MEGVSIVLGRAPIPFSGAGPGLGAGPRSSGAPQLGAVAGAATLEALRAAFERLEGAGSPAPGLADALEAPEGLTEAAAAQLLRQLGPSISDLVRVGAGAGSPAARAALARSGPAQLGDLGGGPPPWGLLAAGALLFFVWRR